MLDGDFLFYCEIKEKSDLGLSFRTMCLYIKLHIYLRYDVWNV